MTIAANNHRSSWSHEVWNQFLYDCCCFDEWTVERTEQCISKSESLRNTVLPVVKGLLRQLYQRILNNFSGDDASMEEDCQAMDYQLDFASAILTNFDAETQTEKVEQLIDHLAEHFRKTPLDFFDWQFMLDVLGDMNVTENDLQSSLLSYEDCIQSYNTIFTHEAKAAKVLVQKFRMIENSAFSLPHLVFGTSEGNFLTNGEGELGELTSNVTRSIAYLSKHSNISAEDIKNFLVDGWCEDEPSCPIYQVNVENLYLSVLKTMKFSLQPYDFKVRETSDSNDLREAGRKIFLPDSFFKDTKDFEHYDPAVLHCLFGHRFEISQFDNKQAFYCNDILRTFTNIGMGYTINAANFYEIYKETPMMDIFCNEIVQSDDKNCGSKNHSALHKIEVNGPKYALNLVLHVPNNLIDSLYIHHPKSVSFLSGNGNELIPRPGMHTKVVVTPRVTITDDALAKADIDKKQCVSVKYDQNPLQLFKHYNKENCLFECHLKYTRDQYGCIPWDFPMLSEDDKICSRIERKRTITDLQNTKEKTGIDCSHCIDGCDRIDYEYTINTTPLTYICNTLHLRNAILKAWKKNKIEMYPQELNIQDIPSYLNNGEDYCTTYAQANISMVEIYVGPSKAVHITRTPRVTFLQQVANLGMQRYIQKLSLFTFKLS